MGQKARPSYRGEPMSAKLGLAVVESVREWCRADVESIAAVLEHERAVVRLEPVVTHS